MYDDEHPQPLPLRKPLEGSTRQKGGAGRLPHAVALAGLALAGLAALHHFHTTQPISPAPLAAPAESTETQAAQHAIHMGAGLPVIPADWSMKALARSNYSKQDQARILAAVKRRDLTLVQMSIAEIDGKIGDTVRIDAGGFSQTLTLSDTLKTVTLPIHHAGEVTISPVHLIAGNALAAGVMTVYGLYTLPTLSSSELVTLDVVAQ